MAREIEWHVVDFKMQAVANVAWAFAKVGRSNAKLFEALACVVERRAREFQPQNLANAA